MQGVLTAQDDNDLSLPAQTAYPGPEDSQDDTLPRRIYGHYWRGLSCRVQLGIQCCGSRQLRDDQVVGPLREG